MPVFKFTSPEGNDYYGEGADAHSAFEAASHEESSPSEIAAMRTRQSVTHGAAAPNVEIPEAAQAVKRGDYGPLREQAFETAGTLGSVLSPVGAMLGEAISPTATAAGGMFDAEPDPKKRKSWQAQYDAAGSKGKRDVLNAFNADQAKVQEANRRQQESERAAASSERERTAGIQRRTDWEAQNADALGKLPQTDRDTIKGAGSLSEAQSLFSQAMERRRQAGMTLAERYPGSVLGLEAAGVAGDVYAPFRMAIGRSGALGKAVTEGAEALKKYRPGSPKVSQAALQDASAARKALEAQTELNTPIMENLTQGNVGKAAGQVASGAGHVALGSAIPYVTGNIPNSIDMLMGALESDPAAKEKAQRAFDSATDPMQFLRAMGVGAGGTLLGKFGAGMKHDTELSRTQGRAVLDEFSARDLENAAKMAAAAARKKELAEAKAAAAASKTSSRESAAAERERIANANIQKTTFAAAQPKPMTEIQQRQADAEAVAEEAAAQRKAIKALKPGKKSAAVSALSPGAAAGE